MVYKCQRCVLLGLKPDLVCILQSRQLLIIRAQSQVRYRRVHFSIKKCSYSVKSATLVQEKPFSDSVLVITEVRKYKKARRAVVQKTFTVSAE